MSRAERFFVETSDLIMLTQDNKAIILSRSRESISLNRNQYSKNGFVSAKVTRIFPDQMIWGWTFAEIFFQEGNEIEVPKP